MTMYQIFKEQEEVFHNKLFEIENERNILLSNDINKSNQIQILSKEKLMLEVCLKYISFNLI